MQSMLPEDLEEITVEDLLDGEVGYTLPWALTADEKGYLWINGQYPLSKIAGSNNFHTDSMKIQRQGKEILVYRNTLREKDRISKGSGPWGNPALPVILV